MRKKKDTHSFDFRPLGLAIRDAREKAGLSRMHSPEKRNGSSGLTARRSASVERCKMAVTRD